MFKVMHNNCLCANGLHATIKENKEVLYVLGWNHLQDTWLNEEKRGQSIETERESLNSLRTF